MALHKKSFLLLLLIIVGAAAFRIFLFSGFVLGDDPAYADYVNRIISNGYPRIGSREVFACRPLMLYSIALPIHLFGWHEWAFILPILICSLLNCALVFIAGHWIAGLRAACIASLAYATFPLDVVHATTMSNDIILSTFVWSGAYLFFASHNHNGWKRNVLSACGGIITGSGVAIKINALLAPFVFIPAFILYLVVKREKSQKRFATCWWGLGWVLAQVFIMVFLYMKSGDPFAHFHTEIRFNRDFNPSGYIPGREALIHFLLYYPKMIIGILREGHPGWQFLPYGYFFLFFLLCLPLAGFKSFRTLRLPAACGVAFLLIMEFAPLQVSPVYIPIHRLPRFLHIASIPAAITIGVAVSTLLAARSQLIAAATAGAFFFLIISSCYWAYKKAEFYQDCAHDQRWALTSALSLPAKMIITDPEMKNYFMFRTGFRPSIPVEAPAKLPKHVPYGSLIIVGGARRPDMDPSFPIRWSDNQPLKDIILVSQAPFPLRPWRTSPLQLFLKK